MNVFIIVFIAFILAWLMRLEIKAYNLKVGKHFALYDGAYRVSHFDSHGKLHFGLNEGPFTYKEAIFIKKIFPHLKMINEQTGLEVLK